MNTCYREMYTCELLEELGNNYPSIKEDKTYKKLLDIFSLEYTMGSEKKKALSKSPKKMVNDLILLESCITTNKKALSIIRTFKEEIFNSINNL